MLARQDFWSQREAMTQFGEVTSHDGILMSISRSEDAFM